MGTNNMQCPEGYIKRKGYTRKFSSSVKQSGYTVRRKGKLYTIQPKVQQVNVPASCVKKRNVTMKSMGKLRKGDLIKYGYQYRLSDLLREKALRRAVDSYGALSVYHKLDAVAKLSAKHAPDAHKIFVRDRNWIRGNFKLNRNN
jgi:ribosomal protein L36